MNCDLNVGLGWLIFMPSQTATKILFTEWIIGWMYEIQSQDQGQRIMMSDSWF